MKKIYLDNAATTKIDKKVLRKMMPYLVNEYGNASSLHLQGTEAKEALENSRKIIAKSINALPQEIYFTSGGTESNNWALKGLFFKNYPEKNHIITTKIEHNSILKTCQWLEKRGAKITYLNVDKEGFVDLEELERAITPKTFLVSIMHANNEIGTIQEINKIGEICMEKSVLFHTDACQSYTKVPIDVKKQNIDLMTMNAHKIHGPKGTGALYIREGIEIVPLLHGGGHERRMRSGTENIPGIVGFAEAVKVASVRDIKRMAALRDFLIKSILEKIPKTALNGPAGNRRLANNVNISFTNIEGEALGGYLESKGILVSTGSACMSHELKSSHVLKAIGLSETKQNSSIRISLSKYTTKKDIKRTIKAIEESVEKLRRISTI